MSEAEGGVIGAILNDPSQFDVVQGMLTPDDFTSARMKQAWVDIAGFVSKGLPVDLIILADRGHDLAALGDLQTNTTASSLQRYAELVREATMRRHGSAILGNSHSRLNQKASDVAAIVADTQASLEMLNERTASGYYDTASAIGSAQAAYAEAASARAANGLAGVPAGLQPVNKISSGFRAKKLYGLAARPSTGKTSLAMQVCFHAAAEGFPIGFASLEMDADELVARAISCKTGSPYWHITSGMSEAQHIIDNATLPDGVYIDDSVRHVNAICSRAAEWHRKHGIKMLVVDHLGLVQGDGAESRAREVGRISFEFKWLAKRLNIPVLLLVQLNRAVETRDGKPKLSDLRDSGEIEENLDVALFIHCEKRDTTNRVVDFGALKNRMGPVGWSAQPLLFDSSTQRWKA